jgi:ribosome-associated heat shock protein Hsp15
MSAGVRIDKWLWAARLYKTRTLAADAVNGGHVHVNGQRCKASRLVQIGEVLKITKAGHIYTIEIDAISDRRGPAIEAQRLYTETEASLQARELDGMQRKLNAMANPRPSSRPDKRQRRQLKNWRNKL